MPILTKLGRLFCSNAATKAIQRNETAFWKLISRHWRGDCGFIPAGDRDWWLETHQCSVSWYRLPDGTTIDITTLEPQDGYVQFPKTYVGIAFEAKNDFYEVKMPKNRRRQKVGR
ncbi:MAG: hypothetical protein WCJ35_25660 [Planctomycetota bacterium]